MFGFQRLRLWRTASATSNNSSATGPARPVSAMASSSPVCPAATPEATPGSAGHSRRRWLKPGRWSAGRTSGSSGKQSDTVPQSTPAEPTRQPVARALHSSIEQARDRLLQQQHSDGHWCYPLEADCTISAEYILMMHWFGETLHQPQLEQQLAHYLCLHQQADGGWELYPGGGFHLSVSVKAYYALKLAGHSADQPHMRRARTLILSNGGAARSNVFTRIVLAQFGQVPWRAIPVIPAEIMLLPAGFLFSLRRIAYWSRTVMVPLAVQYSLRSRAVNPGATGVQELFTTPPEQERHYFPVRSRLNRLFLIAERIVGRLEPLFPSAVRKVALRRAEQWMIERLNGEHGPGAIFPAITNTLQALHSLGYPLDHPACQQLQSALRGLLVEVSPQQAWFQPCLSPVWDTAWATIALRETEGGALSQPQLSALDWLQARQITDQPGDWQQSRPDLAGGGWAFQYQNDHYPDLDDTAVVAWAMQLIGPMRYQQPVHLAEQWLCGMQSSDGGFAAFELDNTSYYLNEIPFADHGALLDPPTADVTARCVMFLATRAPLSSHCLRALRYLATEQEQRGPSAGAWFGRWGTNYIYGTWSVLMALEGWEHAMRQFRAEPGASPRLPASALAGVSHSQDIATMRARAVTWLHRQQREDGGWGESNDSYFEPAQAGCHSHSTSVHTAWALLGLMAAGERDSPSIRAGIQWLLQHQQQDGHWNEDDFNAPGFPRVFHLKYHGYSRYFPLWALARYRNLNL